MKRPSFQFYPGDWTGNSNLRRCTHAEKGVWLEVMCLMHDQAEYGVLRWPLKEIIEAVKCKPADIRALVAKGVLKGSDTLITEPFVYVPRSGRRDGEPVTLVSTQAGPVWYSSRMVKDEHVRTIRGESSRFGEGASPPRASRKPAPKPPFGDGSSSSSSSSSSESAIALSAREVPRSTPAGEACKAMREAGIADVNPGNPKLLALIGRGVTATQLGDAATKAAGKGKGMSYAIAIVEGELRDAAQIAAGPSVVAGPWDASRSSIEAAGERFGEGRWDEAAFQLGRGESFADYTARVRGHVEGHEVSA